MSAVSSLGTFPEIGSMVEDYELPGLRELIVGAYRVLYRYDGAVCRIGRIVRGDRDLARALRHEDFE